MFNVACDRTPSTPNSSASSESVDGPQVLELRTITRLLPHRLTHFTTDSIGNLYWIQESDDGHDVVFILGQDGIPHATVLTSAAILLATDPPAGGMRASESADAGGSIQSVIAVPDASLLFYFNGGAGRQTRTCVGRFDPRAQSIEPIIDAGELATTTGMGASLGLARGKLIAPTAQPTNQPPRVWLWLRHSDASRLYRFDPRRPAEDQPVELTRLFDSLHGKSAVALTRPSLDLSPGPGQSLLVADIQSAALWSADEDGQADRVASLIGLTVRISEPRVRGDGTLMLFSADAERAVGIDNGANDLVANPQNRSLTMIKFPALCTVVDGQVTAIVDADNMRLPDGVAIAKLHMTQILPSPDRRSWIGYDEESGQLMKMILTPRD